MLINDVPIERGAAVLALAEPILLHLARPGLTDLVINRAGVVQVETDRGWERIEDPALDHGKLMALATAIATYSHQKIGAVHPILSASLPTGERIQMIVPPAVEPDTVSFTIRKPSFETRSMEQYIRDGLFETTRWRAKGAKRDQLEHKDRDLLDRLAARDVPAFWREAVLQHRNIAIVGATGSGKTLFMRMLCNLIPDQEHIITIEDVRELFLRHSNVDHLLYSTGGQGMAKVTPSDLLTGCMRQKPDRVLLAELRGAESYDFLKLLTNGHDGSITSYHAGSPQAAIARFILMAKQHPEAASYSAADLKHLFFSAIDIVAHMGVEKIYDGDGQQIGRRWRMTEIYFDPVKKLEFAYDV
ncbi:P-type DNA transfer ATPase VirB11 [Propionivibrio sp.]|uniref:P-type DNA transfer ATPase VirB11 n=1 Tax=Propionivibrio sp. TaxID=2212460 RepID=UPI0039E30849